MLIGMAGNNYKWAQVASSSATALLVLSPVLFLSRSSGFFLLPPFLNWSLLYNMTWRDVALGFSFSRGIRQDKERRHWVNIFVISYI